MAEGRYAYCVERLVSFMYFNVDNRIFLLSVTLIDWCPYKYNSDWFPKWFRLNLCKISITLIAKVALSFAYITIYIEQE